MQRNTNSASATPPQPIALNRRRWTAWFALPFALVMAVSGIWSAVAVHVLLPGPLGIALALLSLLLSCSLAIMLGKGAWDSLAADGPALIVDARGITDHFHLNAFLPWSDIESASIDHGDGDSLTLTLRAGASLPDGRVVRRSFSRKLRRAFNGGDLAIPLGPLSYQPRLLRNSLKYHLALIKR